MPATSRKTLPTVAVAGHFSKSVKVAHPACQGFSGYNFSNMKGAIILVIIISFAPVAMAVDNQPASAQNGRKAENASPPPTISVNCNTCAQTDQSKDQPKGWHKLVAWPEGIATIALILTLGAIV